MQCGGSGSCQGIPITSPSLPVGHRLQLLYDNSDCKGDVFIYDRLHPLAYRSGHCRDALGTNFDLATTLLACMLDINSSGAVYRQISRHKIEMPPPTLRAVFEFSDTTSQAPIPIGGDGAAPEISDVTRRSNPPKRKRLVYK